MHVARAVSLCLTFVLTAAVAATAGPLPKFDAFYVFGDSLADNGNDLIASRLAGAAPPVPPSTSPNRAYFEGRFSNGRVAVEYLWSMLAPQSKVSATMRPFLASPRIERTGALNFAFGGSGTGLLERTPGGLPVPGLQGQVALFSVALAGKKPSPHSLYAIFSGAGDYLRETPSSPEVTVENIARSIRLLYALGARHVIVMDLPDLGRVPLTVNTPASGMLSALTVAHNTALRTRLDALEAALPKLNLIRLEVDDVMSQLPASTNPVVPAMDALVGLLPQGYPASVCLFVNPATCPNVPTFAVGLGFLFWDAEHPTTAVHEQLAIYAFRKMGTVPN